MIQLPIIGSLLEAAGMIIEKKTLKQPEINYKNYTVFEFLAIIIVMIPMLIFTWRVSPEALSLGNLLIFAFVIISAIFANLLIFYSLKRESISEFEPVWLTLPLFTILLAFIFYSRERNWVIVILALAASISLIAAHVKKHHFYFNKYLIAALAGSFLFAVELVASRPILDYYSPFSFYFIRCLFIFIVAALIFRPSFKVINKKTGWMIAAVGLIWALYRAIVYYGYINLGIIFTTTLFILSAVFIMLFAVIFLKEKPTLRQIISAAIIVICVALAVVFGT
jgi:drug/metabolite transporter (DMT)-like permease